MMQSASRQALATLRDEQGSVLGSRTQANTLVTVAQELYAVAALLVGNPQLRRNLGDPATEPERRVELLNRLLYGKVSEPTGLLAAKAVGLRWSSPWDLCDALESAGDDALFAAAEGNGELDRVEDELFRFERILQGDGEVVGLLDEYAVDASRRNEFLDSLVKGKVADVTLSLLHHAVATPRKRSVLLAVDDLLESAAARQERSIARVVSAVPLTDAQQERLAAKLKDMYGRAVTLRTALDPSLQGGLVIRIGDEVIDGSVATRFAQIKAGLTH